MAKKARTEGERQFEEYLHSMHYPYEFEKTYPGRNKKVDFTVNTGREILLADAKDFAPFLPSGFMQFEVYSPIREKIEAGRKKFQEYKDFPCCVVLQNNGNVHVLGEDAPVVLGSMYGDYGFEVPVFLGSGKMPIKKPEARAIFQGNASLTHKKNTRISALLSLRRVRVGLRRLKAIWREFPAIGLNDSILVGRERYENFDPDEAQVGVIVWENCFARLPVSREIFNGPFDQRWGLKDNGVQEIFRGEAIDKLEKYTKTP